MPTDCAIQTPTGNRLLEALPEGDLRRIGAEFEEVHLQLMQPFFDASERIDSVYFPLRSVVSLLTRADGTTGVEVATILEQCLDGFSYGSRAGRP
jgi:hypothetical protein